MQDAGDPHFRSRCDRLGCPQSGLTKFFSGPFSDHVVPTSVGPHAHNQLGMWVCYFGLVMLMSLVASCQFIEELCHIECQKSSTHTASNGPISFLLDRIIRQSHWKRPGGSRAGAFLNEYVRPPWAKGCPEPFSTANGSRGHNPGAETWIAEWTMEQ